MIRVILPAHLRTLAKVSGEVQLDLNGAAPTMLAVLDALETRFPALRGTMRDQVTLQRRAFIRFYANQEDMSLEPADTPLPDSVVSGEEPFLVVGAMAGG